MNKIILIISFLVSPLVSILLNTLSFIKKPTLVSTLMIGLFWGYFGLVYIPIKGFDILSHYKIYDFIKKLDFNQFFIHVIVYKDRLVYYIYWILGKIISNHKIIGFVSAFFMYTIAFNILKKFFCKYEISRSERIMSILLFYSLTPMYLFSGMRNGPAIMLFSFGVYLVLNGEKKGNLYIIMCMLTHSSFISIVIIFYLSLFVKIKYIKSTSILLSLILLIFNIKIIFFVRKILIKFGSYGSATRFTIKSCNMLKITY